MIFYFCKRRSGTLYFYIILPGKNRSDREHVIVFGIVSPHAHTPALGGGVAPLSCVLKKKKHREEESAHFLTKSDAARSMLAR